MTAYPGSENALIVVILTCIRLPVLREKRLFKQNCLLFHYWKMFNQRCRHSTRSGKLSLTEGLRHV